MYEPIWKRPTTVDGALAVLDAERERASVVAGGTDLVPRVRSGEEAPAVLVDLGRIEEMRYVRCDSADGERARIEIGALATHASLADRTPSSERSRRTGPSQGGGAGRSLLAQACLTVGGPQIRARGTIGGNIANASPAADSATALLALDASVRVASSNGGSRAVPLASLVLGPGTTALGADELIVGVAFDEPGPDAAGVYLKEGQRNALAIAVSSVALVLDRTAGQLRIALGSVAPTPVRAHEAESLFESKWRNTKDREALLDAVGEAAARAAMPIDDIRASADYRTTLVGVLVRRALAEAWR
jgi:carbon-monoxide dehydrogenase medium subunit